VTAVLHDIWSASLETICSRVGQGRFNLWFKDTELLSSDAGVSEIGVPNRFVADWLDEHLKDVVTEALEEATQTPQVLRFVVSPRLFQRARAVQLEAQQELLDELPAARPRTPEHDGQTYSLDAFVVGRCNRMAYAAARHVADGLDTQLNPLFIHGSVGLGKTHLLRGICARVQADGTRRAYYASGESFTNQFVASLQHHTLDAFRARFRNVDVLAIDDIHFLANKKATQEEFLHTYDFLSRLNKQIVMASDAHPRDIDCVLESLSNRIVSGMIVRLDSPEYETRMAILRHKLRDYQGVLSDEVLSFVAENVQGNVRELQGAATTLLATARLLGRKVDVEIARQALSSLMTTRTRPVTFADVEREVCRTFNVSPEELVSSKRTRSLTTPRHVAMYLRRELTEHSWLEIGQHFNRRNHTAAIFAHRKIADRIKADPTFQGRIQEMVSSLKDSR